LTALQPDPAIPQPGNTTSGRTLSLARRVELYVTLAMLCAGGLLAMDRLSAPDVPMVARQAAGVVAPPAHDGSGRMFILFVDSLRYETAAQPDVMPRLADLKLRSVSARVTTCVDAVSTPAIRAAFTGRDRASVFGFVANFKKGRESVRSLFTQLHAEGVRISVSSDGTFAQFGSDIQTRPPFELGEGTDQEQQDAAARAAVKTFVSGEHDLVIVHLTYTDHVAHVEGIDGPNYRRTAEHVDALIGEIEAQIAPTDSFVVFGDHGHDAAGRHSAGLDIPTLIVLRGPGYAQNLTLPTVSITEYRYLLGWGLKMPLAAEYAGGRHPEALVSNQKLGARYKLAVHDAPTLSQSGVPSSRRPLFWLLIATMGLLVASVGLRFTSTNLTQINHARGAEWLSRLAFAPLLLLPLTYGALGLTAALATASLLLSLHADRWVRALPTVALAAALPCFALWGHLLGWGRADIHYPRWRIIVGGWLVAMLAGVAYTAWSKRPMRAAWVVLAIPGLLAFPTVYRYGWPAIMGPALIAWAVFMLTYHVRTSPRPWKTMSPLLAVIALALPFLIAESSNFSFDRWRGPTVPSRGGYWIAIGVGAKALLLLRPGGRWLDWLLASCGAAVLVCVQHDWLVLPPGIAIGLSGLAIVIGLSGQRVASSFVTPHRAWLALVFGLWLLALYTIAVPARHGYWLECLLAAVYVGATWTNRHLPECQRPQAVAFLTCIAVLAAGWFSLAWGLYRLEWAFLYAWLDPDTVEQYVGVFIPLIVGRYALVVALFGLVLCRASPATMAAAHPIAMGVLSLKLATLLAVTMGLGYFDSSSFSYLEAVQEIAILLALLLGAVFMAPLPHSSPIRVLSCPRGGL
jgi:hypothetical protein